MEYIDYGHELGGERILKVFVPSPIIIFVTFVINNFLKILIIVAFSNKKFIIKYQFFLFYIKKI